MLFSCLQNLLLESESWGRVQKSSTVWKSSALPCVLQDMYSGTKDESALRLAIFFCHAIAPIAAAVEEVGLQAFSSWVLLVWLKTQTAETDENTLIVSVSMWLRPLL